MSPRIPPNARESVERVPFTVDELNIWFKAAAKEKRPDLKWLPLLATLTGARVGELINLQGKDVYKVNDTLWVADLTTDLVIEGEDTKRQIKNKGSRRLFALHSILEETAFLDYCTKRKGEDWLFPAAHRHGKEAVKDPASAASKRLNARLVAVGIHRPYETTFHSSRHTAKDIMRVAKIDPRTADRQTGHAMKTAGDAYGSKTLLIEEVEVLAALALPQGLDLSPYLIKKILR
nr:site-specific integrase [Devosia sp. MC521]